MNTKLNYKISGTVHTFHTEIITVDQALDCLYLNLQYPEILSYMSFIMVKDELGNLRLQKLLGYGEQKLAIGTTTMDTSIGGVAGTINPGEWEITIGLFTEYVSKKLGDKEATISLTITDKDGEITEPIGQWNWTTNNRCEVSNEAYNWNKKFISGRNWYKGDFHTHTRLSDGKETVKNNMKLANKMGMDFYVPTEHNLMHTGWVDDSKCILPGTEITTNYGHFNLFGIKKMPSNLMQILSLQTQEEMEPLITDLIHEMKEAGAIISINHPFLTEWKWLFEDTDLNHIDTMEIINDPTYTDATPANIMAVDFIDELWNDGHKIYGVGGSDAHNLQENRYEGATLPSTVCDPMTHVYCEDLTPNELIKSVKKGQMCITRFCTIVPEIKVQEDIILPGAKIAPGSSGIYTLYITEVAKEPTVNLIQNGVRKKIELVPMEDGGYKAVTAFDMSQTKWDWIRVEVLDDQGGFLGYVNPIYAGDKVSQYNTFKELKEYAESCGIIHD